MSEPAPEGSQPGIEPDTAGSRRTQPGAWLHTRVRLQPRLLAQTPPSIRRRFNHDWAPVEALLTHARLLPGAVWDYLLSCEGGYALIAKDPSRYVAGELEVRGRTLHNVAIISIQDLAAGNERPLHALGHLLDHYLGCAGRLDGPWLSARGGVTERWQQAGAALARLYALGYAVDDVAGAGVADYFAQSLAVYCRDRRRLNVADPQIEKWLRTTIFDERFWET